MLQVKVIQDSIEEVLRWVASAVCSQVEAAQWTGRVASCASFLAHCGLVLVHVL